MPEDLFPAEEPVPELEFTYWARERFYNVADDEYFLSGDMDLIYDSLKNRMRLVPFGDYLKRYIFDKAHMSGQYTDIPEKQYLDTICLEFSDRQVPCAFRPTTTRLRSAARNWLKQQTVSRSVVLLLGFGLGMSDEDVDMFLTKALQEPVLNAKDPFEAVCRYCYRFGLGYTVFEELWNRYTAIAADPGRIPAVDDLDSTMRLRGRLSQVGTEDQLMAYLAALPVAPGTRRQSVSARACFDDLYRKAREHAARLLTEEARDSAGIRAVRLYDALSRNDQLYDEQKIDRVQKAREKYTALSADDITPGDLESVIFAAVPQDEHGNLLPVKASALKDVFAGKRLSRQHISEILSGDAPVTRHDLITLAFFDHSQKDYPSSRKRYAAFIGETNAALRACGMGPVYIVNPYECFLLMCMLTEDPLGTFADVWEKSYSGED